MKPDLLSPSTLIAMREEFENIWTKEAAEVSKKVAFAKKASLISANISTESTNIRQASVPRP